jgi:hypothetical protein
MTVFGFFISPRRGKRQKARTTRVLAIYVQLTSCPRFLKIVQKHIGEAKLLNASPFGSGASLSATLQSVSLTDEVTHNFNNDIFTAAVFLDVQEAFDAMC